MIKIQYSETNYQDLIALIASTLKIKLIDNVIHFPEEAGSGLIRQINLHNEIEILIYDYSCNKNILFERKKSKKEVFTLRLDEIVNPGENNNVRSSIFFDNSKFDGLYLTNAHYHVKSIHILFSKRWLDNYLSIDEASEEINKYISLKMTSYLYEPMDAEYRRLMFEIFESQQEERLEKMIVQNRVLIILERFFSRMYKRMTDANFDVKLSSDDIGRLKIVQSRLLEDFSMLPPPIEILARSAAMSSSKLKSAFKKMYGMSLHRYYQKHRMNKAKAMLLSKKYSLKEVVIAVGFSNTGNFTKAFRQAFDQLPDELLD